MWGSRQRLMYYRDGRGAYTETFGYPLADAQTATEVDRHPWPKAEWFDYQSVLPAIKAFPDYPFMVGYLAIGWFSWEVRGMENVLTDFSLNPAVGEAVIRNIADFGYEYFTRLLEAVKDHIGKNVVAIHIADDWGMQEGLLASPDVFRKFYAPQYRRFTDLAHSYGLKVEFHSCGAARGLYREFAEVGVDIMNPVQTSAKGMVPREIKKEFGKDLCFSGGIDVQQVLPRATVQQVKDEVKSVLDCPGRRGRVHSRACPQHPVRHAAPERGGDVPGHGRVLRPMTAPPRRGSGVNRREVVRAALSTARRRTCRGRSDSPRRPGRSWSATTSPGAPTTPTLSRR